MVVTSSATDPVVSFQDEGTGAPTTHNDPNSAGMMGGPLAMMAVSGLKVDGMDLSVDATNDTLSVSQGVAMVGHPNTITVQETINGNYTLDWHGDSVLPTVIGSTTGISVDDATVDNYVYLRVDPSAVNSVDIVVSSTENPTELNNTSIYLGSVNSDSDDVFQDPDPVEDVTPADRWFDSLSVDEVISASGEFGKLNAGGMAWTVVRSDSELEAAIDNNGGGVILAGASNYGYSLTKTIDGYDLWIHGTGSSYCDGLSITSQNAVLTVTNINLEEGGRASGATFSSGDNSTAGYSGIFGSNLSNVTINPYNNNAWLSNIDGTVNVDGGSVTTVSGSTSLTADVINGTLDAANVHDMTLDVQTDGIANLDGVYNLTVNTEDGVINGGYLPNDYETSDIVYKDSVAQSEEIWVPRNDSELDTVLSNASDGDRIYLQQTGTNYTADRTIITSLDFIGIGTYIDAVWTIDAECTFENIFFPALSGTTLTLNASDCTIKSCETNGGVIDIRADNQTLYDIESFELNNGTGYTGHLVDLARGITTSGDTAGFNVGQSI